MPMDIRPIHRVYNNTSIEQPNNTDTISTDDMTDKSATHLYENESRSDRNEEKKERKKLNTERRQRNRDRIRLALRIQKRFDKDRKGTPPTRIKKNRFIIDHICYTTASKACVKWFGYRDPTIEPLTRLFEDAPEEVYAYLEKGEISKKSYLTYLKIRDQQRNNKRKRCRSDQREDYSSEVHTSDIEKAEGSEYEKEVGEENKKEVGEENEKEIGERNEEREGESTTEVEGSDEEQG